MMDKRGQFSSKIGFLLAAVGSAVGLGNIWGFPTQAASNGGGAFVLAYLLLAFLLAYPALMAELVIGRYARANIVTALGDLGKQPHTRLLGKAVGYYGVLIASLILSFYAIVAGWMLAEFGQPLTQLIGWHSAAQWLAQESILRNLIVALVFMALTIWIVARGVEAGIEAWSTRLMPVLFVILLGLIVYVLFQPGATQGLRTYLVPDFRQLTDPALLLSAMGQAFFSLSLGVGTMLIYGSYLRKQDSLPRLGAAVTLMDTGIAFTAGLLIIPAMYVAQHHGVPIYGEGGELLAGPGLIFQVLPSLFDTMGTAGVGLSIAFFALMSIAALTSSISMLEAPVSVTVERTQLQRPGAALAIGAAIFVVSVLIIFNMETLFGFIISLTTEYSQPLLGIALCIFVGWIMHRNHVLEELKAGHKDIEHSVFWKVWPFYVRVICPVLILLAFVQSLRG
ncbi:sodium-dependent transporter [Marinimicrobium sp. ABcell2]|uniref:sodium-dependent transporter n=1 Tax=Marinimicrobium sp. ABcell2 TaxID=3069751 RepID=UPI0027B4F4E3|nr:sodium-dependent transporter [Marinimicrobium sp. ABcell2]MDQ2075821.1 sodium-dependent transporter [Marinimicrobium sp. ABcell2]